MKDKDGNFLLLPVRKSIPNQLLLQYLPRWMDNTSPSDLGIIRFGFEMFPNTLKAEYGVANWVRPTLYNILSFKPGMKKIDRAWAVCTSREYSKTTWIAKILALYLMLVGQYGIYHNSTYLLPEADYIRLRAKTQDKAEEKLTNVTMEFSNPRVIRFFTDLRPTWKEIKDEKLKNQGKLVILRNGYIFQGQGLNQPSRGANIRDKRPKVDINDDVENKENTKTPGMRAYNAKEIMGEQFGGLDQEGLTVYIGNFVHQECVMAKLQKPKSGWKKLFFQATYMDEIGIERSGWAKRFSVEYIKRLEEWYKNQPEMGGWKIFRMEYYNELVSDKEYIINEVTGHYHRQDNMNFVKILQPDGTYDTIRCHIVVGCDPAISDEKHSSDGVVVVVAFGSNRQRYVIDVSLAKFDIRDRYHDINNRPRILAISPEEMGNVRRKGMVEEIGRKILRYHADGFVVEKSGTQAAWFNDVLEDIVRPLGLSIPGLPYHPTDEKIYKLETGLMNQIAADRYNVFKDIVYKNIFISQVKSFPDSKLDVLDAIFNAEQLGRIPAQPKFDMLTHRVRPDPRTSFLNKPQEDLEAWMVIG